MKRQGAVIVDPVTIPTLGKFDDSEFEVLLYEFKADLNKYPARGSVRRRRFHSLKDVIAFNTAHAEDELKLLRPGNPDDGREEGAAHGREYRPRSPATVRWRARSASTPR